MDTTELTASLLAGLVELEQSGDVVIVHPIPSALAGRLCARLVRDWGQAFLKEPPFEFAIDLGMKQSARYLEECFALGTDEACCAVEKFVRYLGSNRTPMEVAELISHQGFQEVALGAFFCSHLQRGEYYSSHYLDWRKAHNNERKQQ